MKITGFRTLVLGTPWRNLTYLILETDEGISGIGEARVLGKTHTVGQYLIDVQRHFVGHDPFNIEALYRRSTSASPERWSTRALRWLSWPAGTSSAKLQISRFTDC